MSELSKIISDPRWFADAFDANAGSVLMTRTARAGLAGAPFLDERWDRSGLEQKAIPLSELAGIQGPKSPPAFIWHTAFCCSTLLARCLDRPGRNLSLREPTTMMAIANQKRMQGASASNAALGLLLPALGRPFVGKERVTIKPTNTVNNLILDVMDIAPTSKHLLLTSDLSSFLVSIAKKGEAGRGFARKLFTIFAMDGHPVAQMDPRQLMQMSDLQIAALVWHMQIASFLAAAQKGGTARVAWLDGDSFIAEPEEMLARVDDFLELGLGPDHTAKVAGGPLFKQDAKDSTKAYGPDFRAREKQKTLDGLGPELGAIMDWSYSLFPASPRDGRLSPALAG